MDKEKKQKSKFNYWYLLLIIPFLTSLWPGIYAYDEPRLFGFPFFYWYQLAMVVVSAILTAIVYKKTKSE
jgi:membrane protein implicated in regulation of membrane protease activity